jgi:DNA invertase Pin-like site-specific DNA recombinase
MIYGYARVSTDGQSVAAQVEQLRAAGAVTVFRENVSAATAARAELQKLLRKLAKGDVLLVTRLDRLARSTRDLLNILEQVRLADAGFRSLTEAWADTTTAQGRLLLTVLGGFAEFERELIRARTAEGRKRAKDAGTRFGRTPKLTPYQMDEVRQRRRNGEGVRALAASYRVSKSTIARVEV